ncbi:class I SAM-dependent methyltransferase [Haloarchaeobius sp. HRN-SO-5]|uniref:class I SAM-dependent methyltransferase n=1 Tax=Haloarchaeobius sp. HRN-SO-5 TaxID=3446118 RepID=UPI003EB7BCE1
MASETPHSNGEQQLSDERNVQLYEAPEMVDRYDKHGGDGHLLERERYLVEEHFGDAGGRVLDIGCGTGRTTRPLSDMGFDVVGVDVSEEMVKRARTRHPGIRFEVDDATDLRHDDGSFDHVLFSYYGLDSIVPEESRTRAVAEIFRVLRPGGTFAFNSHNLWYVLPALVSDFRYVREYYLRNGNLRRLFSRYKRDPDELGLDLYQGSPRRTRRQLRAAGFEVVETVGKRDGPLAAFEIRHDYVARKP